MASSSSAAAAAALPRPYPPSGRPSTHAPTNSSSLLASSTSSPPDKKPQDQTKPAAAVTNGRNPQSTSSSAAHQPSLPVLCLSRSWSNATLRARTHPDEATWGSTSTARTPLQQRPTPPQRRNSALSSSPLALCCRYGAPVETVAAILEASPAQLRNCIASRGTPLHEAVANEMVGEEVVRLLLRADEALDNDAAIAASVRNKRRKIDSDATTPQRNDESDSSNDGAAVIAAVVLSPRRAALMQDVDGNTPLHLLIRRAFQTTSFFSSAPTNDSVLTSAGGSSGTATDVIGLIRSCVWSCPEAVGIPDRREYEETPLVLVLKASVYTAGAQGDYAMQQPLAATPPEQDEENEEEMFMQYLTTLEGKIYEIARMMLRAYPDAASVVLTGARGSYTALHSAVFHGRCADILGLILSASDKRTISRKNLRDVDSSRESASARLGSEAKEEEEEEEQHAALIVNKQGETPLHFAAMRNENPRSVRLLAQAAPTAVLCRDEIGLTPLHWLWIRFVSTMVDNFASNPDGDNEGQLEFVDGEWEDSGVVKESGDGGGESEATYALAHVAEEVGEPSVEEGDDSFDYDSFCCEERHPHSRSHTQPDNAATSQVVDSTRPGASAKVTVERMDEFCDCDMECNTAAEGNPPPRRFGNCRTGFDSYYYAQCRTWDFPVDFIRMRHIPSDYVALESPCGIRAGVVLKRLRDVRKRARRKRNINKEEVTQLPQDGSGVFATWRKSLGAPWDHATRPRCLSEREEAVVALFWMKAVALLRAAFDAGAAADEPSMDSVTHPLPRASPPLKKKKFLVVHTAYGTPSCPSSVARLASSLFPSHLRLQDERGMLPLHHAARRPWHRWEMTKYPNNAGDIWHHHPLTSSNNNAFLSDEDVASSSSSDVETGGGNGGGIYFPPEGQSLGQSGRMYPARVLRGETLSVLRECIASSPPEAARAHDANRRLPLHYAVETLALAVCTRSGGGSGSGAGVATSQDPGRIRNSSNNNNVHVVGMGTLVGVEGSSSALTTQQSQHRGAAVPMLDVLRSLVRMYPDALERRDGMTCLYPFMQAAAVSIRPDGEEALLSISYTLLRENPSLVSLGLPRWK